ncbi:hypothetical protein M2116_001727, partial [Aurantimicrobium minutum]|uniref:LGFP repeat-containing protein n=1 Tax=Aurantimicrobium minutum TaxID=708131 RepID=UPI003D6633C4|nr:hypothetical protein [Aurantimicrobium minutum]
MNRKKAAVFSVWLTFISLIFSVITFSNPSPASSADLSKFSAGNIISDSIFYNGSALSASQVQSFLNSKVPTCTINNGQPSHAAGAPWGSSTRIADVCLKDYRQPTSNMAAQPGFCNAYPGSPSESAAEIIAKVGIACNVSQKVLLVLLEKEQSLITDSWPSVAQFDHATGFACYDNGQPCVATYNGFFYQVWAAARQLQRYGNSPFTWYPVGQTSNILYQANRPECGTKAVYIENRATAALYYYTPYTPNAAALAAGYGTGDSCSAYGNRNFYQLFTDWFGTTQGLDVGAPLVDFFNSNGGAQGFLGNVTGSYRCGLVQDACWQKFANGAVFRLSNSNILFVRNDYFAYWGTQGYENGWLGLPTRSTTCGLIQSACWQSFQNGAVYSSSQIGIHSIPNNVWTLYANYSYENGWLGYPISDNKCGLVRSGCWQSFQGGYVYSTPTYGPVAFKSE